MEQHEQSVRLAWIGDSIRAEAIATARWASAQGGSTRERLREASKHAAFGRAFQRVRQALALAVYREVARG